MTNNYILQKVRYALNISDPAMREIFKAAGRDIEQSLLTNLLRKEDERGYVECDNTVLESFLDGLIDHRRGKRETMPGQTEQATSPLTNNVILKKLRIALELNDEAMIEVLKLADVAISKSELTALFRRKGHKNYKECGDQFLRYFLKGLAVRCRN